MNEVICICVLTFALSTHQDSIERRNPVSLYGHSLNENGNIVTIIMLPAVHGNVIPANTRT